MNALLKRIGVNMIHNQKIKQQEEHFFDTS